MKLRIYAILILALLAASAAWGATTFDYTWSGPTTGGDWQDLNWNGGLAGGPLGGYSSIQSATVYIPTGNVVTIGPSPSNSWAAAGGLTIDAGAQLVIPTYNNGQYVFQAASTVNNSGDIQLGTSNGGGLMWTGASIGNGNYQGAALDGGGTITLTNGSTVTVPNYGLDNNVSTVELVNQTIRGDGQIAETNLLIQSQSKIDANHAGQVLLVDAAGMANGKVTNYGVMQASNGGTLQLGSGHGSGSLVTITQLGEGVIQALDGSTVQLGYTNGDYGAPGSITGGTLTSVGTGHIDAHDGFLLDSVTNSGNIHVYYDGRGVTTGLQLANTIDNTGAITLDTAGIGIVAGGATLTGRGTVTLVGTGNSISGGPLTNVDNTIQGGGTLWNLGTLNNGGMIDANQSGGVLLVGSAAIANSGTMQASHGGTLELGVNHASVTITQTSDGVIQALDGSVVRLSDGGANATLVGGALKTVGTGQLIASGASLQDFSISAGTLTLAGDNNLTGAIHNAGVIDVNTPGGHVYWSDGTSFTGGGTIKLEGAYVNGAGPEHILIEG